MGELFALCGLADDSGRRRRRVDRCAARCCKRLVRVGPAAALPRRGRGARARPQRRCRTRSSPPTTRRSSTACCSARSCPASRSSPSIRQIARKWWARPFSLLVNALPVDPTNPLSIRAMIRAVESGSACVIFPEGRITTTGALMKVYEGPAVIAERTGAALAAGAHRRRRVHAVLAARPARSGSAGSRRSASASCRRAAGRARGRDRPRAPRGAAPRARRRDGAVACSRPRRIDTTLFDALLEARRSTAAATSIADDLEFASADLRRARSPPAMRWARVLAARTQPRRARRRAAADVARVGGHLLRACRPTARAGDAQLLDRRRVGAQARVHGGGDRARSSPRARFVEKAKLEAARRGARGAGDDRLPRGRRSRRSASVAEAARAARGRAA